MRAPSTNPSVSRLTARRGKTARERPRVSLYCAAEKYAGGDHAAEGGATEKAEPRRIVRCGLPRRQAFDPDPKPASVFASPQGGTTHSKTPFSAPANSSNDEIEDFVLLRSAPLAVPLAPCPPIRLAAVVDDIDMRISHVIRGADHISNTPKQVLLYRALGADAPDLCASAPDPGTRPHAPLQTPRRHQRQHLSR